MWNWIEYYILGRIKVKRFGEYDYRVCKYSWGDGELHKDRTSPHFWYGSTCKNKYAVFTTEDEAKKAAYFLKGEFV